MDIFLTPRELEILKLYVKGYTRKQIAEKLFIALVTVKTHIDNLRLKLSSGSNNLAALGLIREALILGIITVKDIIED
jgi:DNA-binding NarL/FixJ family response regulator